MSNRETAVVFGGSGFLGSHVADALTSQKYNVRIYDIQPSRYLQAGQEMIVGDVLDASSVSRAVEGCQYVYNFSGIADIGESRKRPKETVLINVLGTLNILEAARAANAKRVLFASTVYVFSDSGSFYRASKQSAEHYIETFGQEFGLDYTILRYGSLYGRRSDEKNGIYRLVRQALETGKIHYAGSQGALREYIHVEDAARLSVRALADEYRNRHIILTGHERMSAGSLINMITEMLGGKVEVTFGGDALEGHYVMSPYQFTPKIGHKLISTDHVDIGQGLLDCMAYIYQEKGLVPPPQNEVPPASLQ